MMDFNQRSLNLHSQFKGICMKQLLFLIIFISGNSFAAGIQKWVDEEGQVHYGDRPPVKVQTEPIVVSRPPANPGRPLPRLNAPKIADDSTKKDATAEKELSNKTEADANKNVCQQAKNDLNVLDQSDVIRLRMSDGTERALTDDEIESRRKKIESDLKQYCK